MLSKMMSFRAIFTALTVLFFLGLEVAAAFETVVIDAGHGGLDEGTEWFRVREKLITLCVAKRLENILISKGIHTVMTRRYDHYVSLDARAEVGANIPNSLFVSIHFNAIGNTSVFGFESFYFGDSSQLVARSIENAMQGSLPSRSRGVTKQDYAVITRTNELAVLIESGFISSKVESKNLQGGVYQQQIAEAIAVGILRIKPLINTDPVRDLVMERYEHDRKKAGHSSSGTVSSKSRSSKKKKDS